MLTVAVVAYPGWGKTRRAARLVAGYHGSAILLERTVAEVEEVLRFARIPSVYGRERLCPLRRTWSECRALRALDACPMEYAARRELVALLASGAPPEAVKARAKSIGACPYPSVFAVTSKPKLVCTYGFAEAHPEVLQNRDVIVLDEAHTLVDHVAASMLMVDDAFIESIVKALKARGGEARRAAYALRAAWRRASDFREFVEMVERIPVETPVEKVVDAFYSGRVAWRGKLAAVAVDGGSAVLAAVEQTDTVAYSAVEPPLRARHIVRVEPPPDAIVKATVYTHVSSRLRDRSNEVYTEYADLIASHVAEDAATLVVFPSRRFMEEVVARLPERVKARLRPPDAIREARPGDVIIDVAGGVATEGVNPPSALRRVIVAGAPFPEPDPRLDLASKLLGVNVYEYVAVVRTVQAVGRLRARGDAILIDDRFEKMKLPPWIQVE